MSYLIILLKLLTGALADRLMLQGVPRGHTRTGSGGWDLTDSEGSGDEAAPAAAAPGQSFAEQHAAMQRVLQSLCEGASWTPPKSLWSCRLAFFADGGGSVG